MRILLIKNYSFDNNNCGCTLYVDVFRLFSRIQSNSVYEIKNNTEHLKIPNPNESLF